MPMKTNNNKNIFLYMLFIFFSNLNIMSAFLSLYFSDIGLSLSVISSVFLLYQATKFIFEIPTGYVADYYGRKVSGLIGMFLAIVSYLILIFMNGNAFIAYVFVFIQAVGYTFISGSVESLFVDSINREMLVRWNAVERVVFYAALALSALLGGGVIYNFGYITAIIIDMLALVITTCAILFMKENFLTEKNREREKGIKKERIHFTEEQKRMLTALYLIDFANAFSYVGVEDLYALYLQKFDLTSDMIGIIIALQLVVSSVFGLLTAKLQKKINKRVLICCFPLIRVLFTIPIYAFNLNVWMIPLLYLIQFSLFTLYAPIKYELFQNNLEHKYRARALSFQSIVISCGAILFYGFSSVMEIYFSLAVTVTVALVITFLLLTVSTILLKGMNK